MAVGKVGDVMVYDDRMKERVEEYYRNKSLERANYTFAAAMLTADPGEPTQATVSVQFFLGISANLFIVYLSFCSKHIKDDFRLFFGNLAIVDALFAFCGLLQNLVRPFLLHSLKLADSIYFYTLFHVVTASFSASMVSAIALVSFHRYMLIIQDKKGFFTKPRIILLCLSTYYPMIWVFSILASMEICHKEHLREVRIFAAIRSSGFHDTSLWAHFWPIRFSPQGWSSSCRIVSCQLRIHYTNLWSK